MNPVPTGDDFDDMHHALGRPDGRHVQPYRNRYCTDTDGSTARRFEALGLWRRIGLINAGAMAMFEVNERGRELLMAWLDEKNRSAGVRAWAVGGGGVTERIVMARTRSAARYDVYLSISDVYHFDGGFRGFLALGVRARAA